MRKQLWLLVGGNGAGKSTFYRLYLEPRGLPFVNADVLARIAFPDAPEAHSYEAARLADQQRHHLLKAGCSFCFETVFSHPSKIDFLIRAKDLGYETVLVMIHLDSRQLNVARVAQRVTEGGHTVPSQKVCERIPRMLRHMKIALPHCDQVRVYDNSSAATPFVPVLTVINGHVASHQHPLPFWALELVGSV